MSFIVNDSMPRNCTECSYRCGLNIIARQNQEGRHEHCPLVALPPHGDLGDTSELYVDILADLQTSKIQTLQDVLKILKIHFENAPVILKANYKEESK